MICTELDFVTIACCPGRKGHHAGIQYQQVQSIFLACEFPRSSLHARQVCEIALDKFDGSGGNCCFYVFDRGEGFLFASCCEVDTFWVVLGELEDGLFSETDVAFAEKSLAIISEQGGSE
jgi:hypothetical protein